MSIDEKIDSLGNLLDSNDITNQEEDFNIINTNSQRNQNENNENIDDLPSMKINDEINNNNIITNKNNKNDRYIVKTNKNLPSINDFLIVLDNSEEYKKIILDQARKKIWRAVSKIKKTKNIQGVINAQSKKKWYIINPEEKSKIKFLYGLLIYFCLYLDFFISPFEYYVYYNQTIKMTRIIIFDSIFLSEIIFKFFTSYYDTFNKYYVTDIKLIFCHYIKTSFIINILYVCPFYLILPSLEIIRLLKVYRYPSVTNKIKQFLTWILSFMIKNITLCGQIVRVTTFFFNLCYILHFCACIYCFLGFKFANSWMWAHSDLIDVNSILDIYVSSYYFITETFTSTGYGDLTPVNSHEIIFIMCCQILNCGLYAHLLSNVLDILINKENSSSYSYRANQNNLQQWIKYYMNKLPSSSKKSNLHRSEVWEETKKFHELYYDTTKNFGWLNDMNFFDQMKPINKNELLNQAFDNIFKKFNKFFENFTKFSSKVEIIKNLKTSIQTEETVIIDYKKDIHKIYLIDKGVIDIYNNDQKINSLNEGDFFGIEAINNNIETKSKFLYKVDKNSHYVILFTIDINYMLENVLNYDGESFKNLFKYSKKYIKEILKVEGDNNEIINTNVEKNEENENNNFSLNENMANAGHLGKLNEDLEEYKKMDDLMGENNLRLDVIEKQIKFINKYYDKVVGK